MDVICAQNISIRTCEHELSELSVCVFWSLKSFRRGLNSDKKRIIRFLYRWMSRYWCALSLSLSFWYPTSITCSSKLFISFFFVQIYLYVLCIESCCFAHCHFSSASMSLHRVKRQASEQSERVHSFGVYVMQLLYLYIQHSNNIVAIAVVTITSKCVFLYASLDMHIYSHIYTIWRKVPVDVHAAWWLHGES